MGEQEDEVLATLQSAIKLEKDGIRFYGRAADLTKDQRGKATFISLVRDEQSHLEALQKELDNIRNNAGWLDFREVLPTETGAREMPDIFPQDEQAVREMVRPQDSDLDALRLAAKKEEESYDFYSKAAATTTDPDGKALYNYLAEQETDHLRLISNTLSFLENPSEWFQSEEKPIFEG